MQNIRKFLKGSIGAELPLVFILATATVFVLFGEIWLADLSNVLWLAFIFAWLFGTILKAAFAVVRHADALAEILGEPFGTLVLTLSVITIEVLMISSVMLNGENNPAMARDTMFGVVMISMNGMVGLALLLGGWKHREQQYNLQGANSYLSVIIPLAVLAMILPDFTQSTPGASFSEFQAIFLIMMTLGLYAAFLIVQTMRHRQFFVTESKADDDDDKSHTSDSPPKHALHHSILLLVYIAPVVLLAKKLAIPIDYGIDTLDAPHALGGFIVAALVLAPEAMGATRSAIANQLQRSVNICLGSVLATIGLTVPAVLLIGLATGRTIELGLPQTGVILLLLTLFVSVVTFSSARTNILQGLVHLILFFAYIMLIFQP